MRFSWAAPPCWPFVPSEADVRRRVVLRFVLLESGVALASVTLLLGPIRWPLYAAFVPLMAMVAAFPREQ